MSHESSLRLGVVLNLSLNLIWAKIKYSFVSGALDDENKSHAGHAGGRKNIFFGKSESKNIVGNSNFIFLGHSSVDELEFVVYEKNIYFKA